VEKLIKFIVKKAVYLLGDLVIFLSALLFLFLGYNEKSSNAKGAIYLSIGTSLIAAGIVGVVELWKDLSRSKLLANINNVILQGGIVSVSQKRDLDKYDVLMGNLTDKLDITGYSLNAFYESYSDLLIEKCKSTPSLIVRMLLVKPKSIFSKHRAELEMKAHKAVESSVDRIKEKFSECDNIQIKIIDAPLTTMIFRIDDVMFVGPHFHKKYSKSTLTLELSDHGWIFKEYEKEFERLWNDGQLM